MPITKSDYGVHKDVLFLDFGNGDIMLTKSAPAGQEFESTLILSEATPHEIGSVSDEYKGKYSDEIPNVKMVMCFTKPESITALIHSLVEIQKEVFRAQPSSPLK